MRKQKPTDTNSAGSVPPKRSDYEYCRREVTSLIPDPLNARLHSEAQIRQLVSSIREFGFTNPVLIDEHNNIIAGHGRIAAAQVLKMRDLPCIIVAGLSEPQRRALVIADNKLALNATWDNDLLLQQLGDITEDGFDLSVIGFSTQEMEALLGLKPDDEVPGASDEDAYKEQYAVMVLCKSEPDQERVYNELQAAGYDVKVVAT